MEKKVSGLSAIFTVLSVTAMRGFPRELAFGHRLLEPLDGILFALDLGLALELRLFPGRTVHDRALHARNHHLPVRGRHARHGEEHEEEEHQVRGDIREDDQPDIAYFFSFVAHVYHCGSQSKAVQTVQTASNDSNSSK